MKYNIIHSILVSDVKFPFIQWMLVKGNYCTESVISSFK
jgi:hypothetical protein